MITKKSLIKDSVRQALMPITPQTKSLPTHIVAAIKHNDEASEVLVKILQILIFGAFGIMFLITPVPEGRFDSQIPIVLTAYIMISATALAVAVVRPIPPAAIYASIFIDMALLTYLIWSFSVQFNQPPASSLKAPIITFYFILIGVRALRFEARYVIAAGTLSIICWTTLIMFVLFGSNTTPTITNDYVVYQTSQSVLMRAETTKLLSLAIFTIVLAIAVRRAHSFVVTSISESKAAQALARFIPSEVANQIRDTDRIIKPGEGVRRDIAILNIDIRGFTSMVQNLEPQEAMTILADYQKQVVPIVSKNKGVVDKFMGDGIMVTFGAVEPDEQYCANALRCATEILGAKKMWGGTTKDIVVNLAISSGAAIYGAVGEGDRLEYTVIGAAVNRSAKLEKLNKKFGSDGVCDVQTYDKAIEQGYEGTPNPKTEDAVIDGQTNSIKIVLLSQEETEDL